MNKSRLKRYPVALGVTILLVAGAYGCLWLYKREHDNTAMQAIHRMIPLLEDYRHRTGSYPERMDLLPEGDRARKRILTFFSPPELHYDTLRGGYRIRFYQFPLGPFQGYDSRSRQWFCEE